MKTTVSKTLANHNLKVTEARTALIDLVTKADKPVDSQYLIEKLQKELAIDRVTVFRILNILTEHNILRKLEFGEGKARYEVNNAEHHHHHLICERCGNVIDIPDTIIPETMEQGIEKEYKFLIKRHTLEFFGLCADCQKADNIS